MNKVNNKRAIATFTLQSNIKTSRFKSQEVVRQDVVSLFNKNEKQSLIKFEKLFLKELNVVIRRYYLVYLANSKKHESMQKMFFDIRFSYEFYAIVRNRITKLYKN